MSAFNEMLMLNVSGFSAQIEKLVVGTNKAIRSVTRAVGLTNDLDCSLGKIAIQSDKAAATIENLTGKIDDLGIQSSGVENEVDKLLDSMKKVIDLRGMFDFVSESFDMSNFSKNVDLQLRFALKKIGATEAAFESLKAKAAEIQIKTVYSDEVMLSGASVLASYISDSDAIVHLMDTLTNYAAGMSGGGKIDSQEMAMYAEQMGNMLNGDVNGAMVSNFDISESQKEILKAGSDIEKALVLDEVVNQSWVGLAVTMADLPENKISRVNSLFADMREELGARITSSIMVLYSKIAQYMPQIESIMFGIGVAINFIVLVLATIVDKVGRAASFFTDNWSSVGPIVLGAAAALLTFAMALWIVKTAQLAVAVTQKIVDLVLGTSPIIRIIALVVGLIVLLASKVYSFINSLKEAAGICASTTGMIGGTIASGVAFMTNIILSVVNFIIGCGIDVYNKMADFANFLTRVFKPPVIAIATLFAGLFERITDLVLSAANLIDNVFGTNLAEGIGNACNAISTMIADFIEDDQIEVVKKLDATDYYFDMIDKDAAYKFGYGKGAAIEEMFTGIGGMDGLTLDGSGFDSYFDDLVPDRYLDDIGSSSNPAAVEGTGAGGAVTVNMADEDIQYLRDLAERDYIAKIANNTLAPNIRVEFSGPITKEVDAYQLLGVVEETLAEEIAVSAEGEW